MTYKIGVLVSSEADGGWYSAKNYYEKTATTVPQEGSKYNTVPCRAVRYPANADADISCDL
jgi:hypothetical protein